MIKPVEELRANVRHEATEFNMYRNSAQMRQYVAMLDSMIEVYANELITIAPDKLQHKQGAMQQVIALRNLATQDSIHLSITV